MTMLDSRNKNGWKPSRTEVNEWLRSQELCVFSTLDETGAPMSATVAYSVTLDSDLLIGTDESSRKSHNVDGDNRVAMTITDSQRRITAQLQGTAEKVSKDVFEKTYAAEHYRLRPKSLSFKDVPGQCHILVRPRHIKFSDVQGHPWAVTEFTVDRSE